MYFGLDGRDPMALEAIGTHFGRTKPAGRFEIVS
jgi:hypothetical protein